MTKTKIIRDVSANDLPLVVAGLRADGYLVHSEKQSNGLYSVIGVKHVPDVAGAISSDAVRSGPASARAAMAKTKIVTDVAEADVDQVEAAMQADGYTTTRHRQPDGRYTVVGVKQVRSVSGAISSTAESAPTSATRGRPKRRR